MGVLTSRSPIFPSGFDLDPLTFPCSSNPPQTPLIALTMPETSATDAGTITVVPSFARLAQASTYFSAMLREIASWDLLLVSIACDRRQMLDAAACGSIG